MISKLFVIFFYLFFISSSYGVEVSTSKSIELWDLMLLPLKNKFIGTTKLEYSDSMFNVLERSVPVYNNRLKKSTVIQEVQYSFLEDVSVDLKLGHLIRKSVKTNWNEEHSNSHFKDSKSSGKSKLDKVSLGLKYRLSKDATKILIDLYTHIISNSVSGVFNSDEFFLERGSVINIGFDIGRKTDYQQWRFNFGLDYFSEAEAKRNNNESILIPRSVDMFGELKKLIVYTHEVSFCYGVMFKIIGEREVVSSSNRIIHDSSFMYGATIGYNYLISKDLSFSNELIYEYINEYSFSGNDNRTFSIDNNKKLTVNASLKYSI